MESKIRNVLGPQIRYFRLKMGLSQEELASLLSMEGIDVDRTIVSKIENQTRVLYDYQIIAIVKALKIEYEDLFK